MDLSTYMHRYAPIKSCQLRVVCFHNAGSSEAVWTTTRPNPLKEWAVSARADPQNRAFGTHFSQMQVQNDVELIAVDYPGRASLLNVPFAASVQARPPSDHCVL